MPLTILNKDWASGYTAAAIAVSFAYPRGGTNLAFIRSFQYTTEFLPIQFLEESELTAMCMQVSESALSEIWEDEEDSRWEKFLKD